MANEKWLQRLVQNEADMVQPKLRFAMVFDPQLVRNHQKIAAKIQRKTGDSYTLDLKVKFDLCGYDAALLNIERLQIREMLHKINGQHLDPGYMPIFYLPDSAIHSAHGARDAMPAAELIAFNPDAKLSQQVIEHLRSNSRLVVVDSVACSGRKGFKPFLDWLAGQLSEQAPDINQDNIKIDILCNIVWVAHRFDPNQPPPKEAVFALKSLANHSHGFHINLYAAMTEEYQYWRCGPRPSYTHDVVDRGDLMASSLHPFVAGYKMNISKPHRLKGPV